jgi:hypothetical protein
MAWIERRRRACTPVLAASRSRRVSLYFEGGHGILAGDGFSQTATTGTFEIGAAYAEMSNRRDFETCLRRGGYVNLLVMTND